MQWAQSPHGFMTHIFPASSSSQTEDNRLHTFIHFYTFFRFYSQSGNTSRLMLETQILGPDQSVISCMTLSKLFHLSRLHFPREENQRYVPNLGDPAVLTFCTHYHLQSFYTHYLQCQDTGWQSGMSTQFLEWSQGTTKLNRTNAELSLSHSQPCLSSAVNASTVFCAQESNVTIILDFCALPQHPHPAPSTDEFHFQLSLDPFQFPP